MIKEILFLFLGVVALSMALPDDNTTERGGKIVITIPDGDVDDGDEGLASAESAYPQWGWGGYRRYGGGYRGGYGRGYYPRYGGGWGGGYGYGYRRGWGWGR